MHITEYLAKAFIISLPARSDRRRQTDRMLGRLGLSPQGGWAEYFPAVGPESAAGFPSAGARGCYLSHLEVLKKAVHDGLPNVVVMEDDLQIAPTFMTQSPALVKALRNEADWGFAYFGHVLKNDPNHDPASPFRLTADPIRTTHFYAVNGPVLPRVLNFLESVLARPAGHADGGPMHVDGAYSFFREKNQDVITLASQPNLGWQRYSRSDLSPHWLDKAPGMSSLMQVARSIKTWAKG